VFSVITNIQLAEPGTSVCCLLFVNDGKELWVGCGNKVGIINVDTLEVVHKFPAYASPRSNVRSMVTNGPTVFTINRKTPEVFQWSVETRQCICKFKVEQENPRGLNVARLVTMKEDNDVSESDVTDDVTVTDVSDEASKKADDVEGGDVDEEAFAKDPEMFIDIQERPSYRQPSLMRSLKRGGSRNSSRKKQSQARESTPGPQDHRSDSPRKMRSRTQVCESRIFFFCVLLVCFTDRKTKN
jgi:hypothetical protein